MLAYALHHEGAFHRDALGAVSEAARIAAELGEDAEAVVVGGDEMSDELAAVLGRHGARRVWRARAPAGLAAPAVDALAAAVAAGGHRWVLVGGGVLGVEIGAALAARLCGGVTMEVTSLRREGDRLVATRPVLGDSARAEVAFLRSPGVLIARVNAFAPVEREAEPARVEELAAEPSPWSHRARVVRRRAWHETDSASFAGDAVVGGGRGLGSAEAFADCEALARELGGSVAATRAVVDAGWYPYSAQVGQTGAGIFTRLYLAAGVSGAPQHRAGVQAGAVVAINSDAKAPIFGWADLGVVGDAKAILPRLTTAVRAAKARRRASSGPGRPS